MTSFNTSTFYLLIRLFQMHSRIIKPIPGRDSRTSVPSKRRFFLAGDGVGSECAVPLVAPPTAPTLRPECDPRFDDLNSFSDHLNELLESVNHIAQENETTPGVAEFFSDFALAVNQLLPIFLAQVRKYYGVENELKGRTSQKVVLNSRILVPSGPTFSRTWRDFHRTIRDMSAVKIPPHAPLIAERVMFLKALFTPAEPASLMSRARFARCTEDLGAMRLLCDSMSQTLSDFFFQTLSLDARAELASILEDDVNIFLVIAIKHVKEDLKGLGLRDADMNEYRIAIQESCSFIVSAVQNSLSFPALVTALAAQLRPLEAELRQIYVNIGMTFSVLKPKNSVSLEELNDDVEGDGVVLVTSEDKLRTFEGIAEEFCADVTPLLTERYVRFKTALMIKYGDLDPSEMVVKMLTKDTKPTEKTLEEKFAELGDFVEKLNLVLGYHPLEIEDRDKEIVKLNKQIEAMRTEIATLKAAQAATSGTSTPVRVLDDDFE
jgi:hypothetical protein